MHAKLNLKYEELHNLYSLPKRIVIIKLRRMRRAGHAAGLGGKRNAYQLYVGQPDGKRPLGRLRHRGRRNMMGWYGLDSSGSV
jgi:hypothetical protein